LFTPVKCAIVGDAMPESRSRRRYIPGPRRGDERRAALLEALDELLETRALADVGIADITRTAGVTRSAFYFYFPTKAAAVAALLADFYDDMTLAAADWYDDNDDPPLDRLRAGFEASVRTWRARSSLMVAMLDALPSDPEVRELWDGWVDGFVERVAERIDQERGAGIARQSIEGRVLAPPLVGAVFHVMERDVRSIRAGKPPADHVAPALTEIWHRTIYPAG